MNKILINKVTILTTILFVSISAFSQVKKVEVINKSAYPLQDVTVEIPVNKLKLPIGQYESVVKDQTPAPVELIRDIQGNQFALVPVAYLNANEKTTVEFRPGTADTYPKRAYAELAHKENGEYVTVPGRKNPQYKGDTYWVKPNQVKLPGTFRDHSYFLKYEGPGWENDKVSFRFYLDNRNIIDVNGKKTSSIVLPAMGVDNFDSYHEMAPWGMDNMKVGKALGLGTIASWDGKKVRHIDTRDSTYCVITADGKIASQIKTIYYGWENETGKSTLTSLISLYAGSRASKIELLLENNSIQLATGIIIDKTVEYITPEQTNGDWTYISTFGKQSLNKDNQGLAVFAKKSQIESVTADDLNYVFVFKKGLKQVEYYIMPTWELDKEPVVTKADFMKCINQVLDRLNNPVTVK